MSPNIWASFVTTFVAKNFQKSPNLVTLHVMGLSDGPEESKLDPWLIGPGFDYHNPLMWLSRKLYVKQFHEKVNFK